MATYEDKPGIEEQYSTAAESSNLRVGNDPSIRTPGDMIAAAGMNKHRMGLALRRLHSEWSAGAKPLTVTAAQIEALAKSYKVEPAMVEGEIGKMEPNPNAGMVEEFVKGRYRWRLPLVIAHEERKRWHLHELGLFLMGLKSLPWVRDAMKAKAAREGWGCDEHVIAKVLLWWLDPKCQACGGAKEKVIAGTGRTNGKLCRPCRGTGVKDAPHGLAGERLARYIHGCLAAAKRELSEGMTRERTQGGTQNRENEAASQEAARNEQVARKEREEADRIARGLKT